MGGSSRGELALPSNGLWFCDGCHAWVEKHRVCAYSLGLLLVTGAIASTTPVLIVLPYGLQGYFLLDDGGVTLADTAPWAGSPCLDDWPR